MARYGSVKARKGFCQWKVSLIGKALLFTGSIGGTGLGQAREESLRLRYEGGDGMPEARSFRRGAWSNRPATVRHGPPKRVVSA